MHRSSLPPRHGCGQSANEQRQDGRWVAEFRELDARGKTKVRILYARTEEAAWNRLDQALPEEYRGLPPLRTNLSRTPFDPSNQHVYVIQCEAGGPAKIGIAANVAKRLRVIQAYCPFPLRVVAVIESGGADVEQHLHLTLRRHRLHSEWFQDSRAVRRNVLRYVRLAGHNSYSHLTI